MIFEERIKKIELLPTRDCEAGCGPEYMYNLALPYFLHGRRLSFIVKKEGLEESLGFNGYLKNKIRIIRIRTSQKCMRKVPDGSSCFGRIHLIDKRTKIEEINDYFVTLTAYETFIVISLRLAHLFYCWWK